VGIKTTLPFFERVLSHPAFVAGDFDTSFVTTVLGSTNGRPARRVELAVATAAIRAFEERRARRVAVRPTGPSPWRAAGLREAHDSRLGSRG
jgi:acetyl/propionyl-CoA carboxylase alpha subunit